MKLQKYIFLVGIIMLFLCTGLIIIFRDNRTDELVYFPNNNPDDLRPIMHINEEAKYLSELIFDGLVNKTVVENGREEYSWALVSKDGYKEDDINSHFSITL